VEKISGKNEERIRRRKKRRRCGVA
jgi:hypothetical protein